MTRQLKQEIKEVELQTFSSSKKTLDPAAAIFPLILPIKFILHIFTYLEWEDILTFTLVNKASLEFLGNDEIIKGRFKNWEKDFSKIEAINSLSGVEKFRAALRYYKHEYKSFDSTHTLTPKQFALSLIARKGDLVQLKKIISTITIHDFIAKDRQGRSALDWALKHEHQSFVNYLHQKYQLPEKEVYWALYCRQPGAVSLFDNFPIRFPLHLAAQVGNVELAERALQLGSAVDQWDEKKWPPLFYAAQNGYDKVAEILLKNKASANRVGKDDLQAIDIAVKNSEYRVVEILLQYGAQINQGRGYELLTNAANKNGYSSTKVMEVLLKAGVNPNEDNYNPLICQMAHRRKQDKLNLLLQYGANPNAHNGLLAWQGGFIPLYWAVIYGSKAMAQLLLLYGADGKGATIISYSAERFAKEQVKTGEGLAVAELINFWQKAKPVITDAKLKYNDAVNIKFSKLFHAFANPPLLNMSYRDRDCQKLAENIADEFRKDKYKEATFEQCEEYVNDIMDAAELTDKQRGAFKPLRYIIQEMKEQIFMPRDDRVCIFVKTP